MELRKKPREMQVALKNKTAASPSMLQYVYNPTTRPMRWSKKDDFECKVYGHWARDRPWIEWKQNVLKAAKGRGEMHYGGQVKKEAN